jgi:hypothetical protein
MLNLFYPMGSRGHFLEVKRAEREADHSSSSAEFQNAWSYNSTPRYAFIAWCSVKKIMGTILPLPHVLKFKLSRIS